jgi:hypothetical protein
LVGPIGFVWRTGRVGLAPPILARRRGLGSFCIIASPACHLQALCRPAPPGIGFVLRFTPQTSTFSRIGFVSHTCPSSHAPGAPSRPALPGKLALFFRRPLRVQCVITPFLIRSYPSLGPSRNWVCLAHLPFVRPRRPVSRMPQFAQVWVCFAHLPLVPRPPGPVPPEVAGNWLCLYNRPQSLAGRDWLRSTLHTSNFNLLQNWVRLYNRPRRQAIGWSLIPEPRLTARFSYRLQPTA